MHGTKKTKPKNRHATMNRKIFKHETNIKMEAGIGQLVTYPVGKWTGPIVTTSGPVRGTLLTIPMYRLCQQPVYQFHNNS